MGVLSNTRVRAFALAVILAAAFFAQGLYACRFQSVTWDEPSFVSSGYVYLKYSDFRLNHEAPPLMQELSALPLLFMGVKSPPYSREWNIDPASHADFGRLMFFGIGNDPQKMAFWDRLPVLVLGALLVIAVFLWGRSVYGDAPALAGAALAAFSPNLLAHAGLATTDLGCAAFMFFAVWSFRSAVGKGTYRHALVCGLVTGLALLTKYTALLLAPVYVLLAAWLVIKDRARYSPAWVAGRLGIIVAVSLLVVGAGYNLSFDLKGYFNGLSNIYANQGPGYFHYLLGVTRQDPWWYYNLVGIAAKVPVSSLVLVGAAGAAVALDRRGKEDAAFMLAPAAVVIAASFFDTANLGLRRVLPALPFLFLFAGYALAGSKNTLRTAAVAALVVMTAVSAVQIHPHYLSYMNFIAGGPENGPEIFDESNVDWGQDLPDLAEWQKTNPDASPIRLAYHGSAYPSAYGVNSVEFDLSEAESPKPGYYAMSVHKLVWLRKMHQVQGRDTDWLAKYKPIARAGYSIYIYRF